MACRGKAGRRRTSGTWQHPIVPAYTFEPPSATNCERICHTTWYLAYFVARHPTVSFLEAWMSVARIVGMDSVMDSSEILIPQPSKR